MTAALRIAIGSDHRGDTIQNDLETHLTGLGHTVTVMGGRGEESRDYPDSAQLVGEAVASGSADRGILICGSGIGISIAANKVTGVRAALVHNAHAAEMSRRHNNANVLCLGADVPHDDPVLTIVDRWLSTEFEGGRHERRIDKMMALESNTPQQC